MDIHATLKKVILVGALVISFIAGGLVVYFALSPYYDGVKKKMSRSQSAQTSTNTPSQTKAATSKDAEKKSGSSQENVPSIALFPAHAWTQPTLQYTAQEAPQIIDILRSDFVDAPNLVSQQLSASSLGKVLSTTGKKVLISATPLPSSTDFLPIRVFKLPNNISYWRVPSFNEKSISKLIKSWNEDTQNKKGLIIDLRDFQAVNDYPGMADFAGLFLSPKTPLFTVQGIKIAKKSYASERQPLNFPSHMPLIVLINGNTRGAGELLASLLDQYNHAILMGQTTPCEIAMYSEVRLNSGRFLRIAVANVLLPDGRNAMDDKALQPEISISMKPEEESSILQMEYNSDPAEYIKELPTLRKLNEAGLVKEENVELDEMVEQQSNPNKNKPPTSVRDLVLRNASDVIRGISISFDPPTVSTLP